MPLDVRPLLSIDQLTDPPIIITGIRPKAHSLSGAETGRSKPDRHGGGEGGKLDDPALAVARYDEPGSTPTALPPPTSLLISSGHIDS